MLAMIFCAFCSWLILILSSFSVWLTLKKGTNHLKRLHQIPCHNCEFFTNDYRLKCTVNPIKACSEEAIGCIDFEPKTCNCNASQRGRRKLS
ncbi:hypothetical protein [Nodularia sp. UHCC 0506]|uniref:hypothetical protein n=1 Tax=Nodularia sp. UHCC 0506 TaxID=3110243 RepID=UPI002B211D89|nr:hypothetical protein [Nodularia sp. UHCC 0506]MEA5514307.1 hypothetical protein [Nodularia sp. UHCC 0506]